MQSYGSLALPHTSGKGSPPLSTIGMEEGVALIACSLGGLSQINMAWAVCHDARRSFEGHGKIPEVGVRGQPPPNFPGLGNIEPLECDQCKA